MPCLSAFLFVCLSLTVCRGDIDVWRMGEELGLKRKHNYQIRIFRRHFWGIIKSNNMRSDKIFFLENYDQPTDQPVRLFILGTDYFFCPL